MRLCATIKLLNSNKVMEILLKLITLIKVAAYVGQSLFLFFEEKNYFGKVG